MFSSEFCDSFNSTQDRGSGGGGGGREMGGVQRPPTSFFLVTSKNVGISPQDSVTFIFKAFATLL